MTPTAIRVRLLVVIDPNGKWESVGSHSWSDAEATTQLQELTDDLGRTPWGYHWVEADVPLPVHLAESAIEGDVTNAG